MVDLSKLKSIAEWPKARASIESAVMKVLGAMPKERAELQVKTSDETCFSGYTRKRVKYFVDDWERISAWLFTPDGQTDVPALLCCHQGIPQGKAEVAGLGGDPMLAFAEHYAQLGYVTIAPDTITAGERVSSRLDPFDTASFYKDNPKQSAFGKMLWDHIHALDVLCGLECVDPERLGVVGHGLGGTNALLLAAVDERIQACVASCGFTRFADDKKPERWSRDSGFIFMPKLKKAIETKEYPFDWEHILAMAAPTPILVATALNDDQLSNTKSCGKACKLASTIYKFLGENSALESIVHKDGHALSRGVLDTADEWFERWI
jgi:dienelactone hydrolase